MCNHFGFHITNVMLKNEEKIVMYVKKFLLQQHDVH